MPTFYLANPSDRMRTQAEEADWNAAQDEKAKRETRERITLVLSGIAALAAVAGVIVQLVSMR